MKSKNQRLILALLALAAVIGAGLLAVSGLKQEASFFYAPGDVRQNGAPLDRAVRLGGMVKAGSIIHDPDGVTLHFIVEDGSAEVPVSFKGIAPDLFKEKSGVVAEGRFQPDGRFVATNLLAKHDERYMPPELAGKMHKTDSLKP
ncbi:MAG: cytochrome c maturation protein CcmE [Chakrabartia sp.]